MAIMGYFQRGRKCFELVISKTEIRDGATATVWWKSTPNAELMWKSVNPYRTAEVAVIHSVLGWVLGPKRTATYIHLSDRDVDGFCLLQAE